MRRAIVMTLGAAFASLMAMPASAQNAGDQVTCAVTGTGTFSCSPVNATVGAGAEFTIGSLPANPYLSADFGQNQLFIDALFENTLGGTILNFSDPTNPFTSFSFVSNTGFSGFDASDISLSGAGVLTLDLRDTNNAQGARITLQLNNTGAVPEPATWAMMLLGFGAIGGAMRRRQRALAAFQPA
jgi:hypothetical protein